MVKMIFTVYLCIYEDTHLCIYEDTRY